MTALTAPMQALTVRQPSAWAISRRAATDTAKGVENRSWTTGRRGLLAIHAGTAWDPGRASDDIMWAAWTEYVQTVPARIDASAGFGRSAPEFVRGAIVAVANLAEIHRAATCARPDRNHPDGPYACSPWARGGGHIYHWTLTNVIALPRPIPCPGRFQLWTVAPEVEAEIYDQVGEEWTQLSTGSSSASTRP